MVTRIPRAHVLGTLMVGALLGCPTPTVDATSDETMKASVAEMTSSFDEAQLKKFSESLMAVALADLTMADVMSGKKAGDSSADTFKKLHGKTAEEVMAMAESIRETRLANERAQALSEIGDLQTKLKSSEAAKVGLAKFEVVKSRFYKQAQRFGRAKPIIELSVKNGTDRPISRAYFVGTLATPGRSIPWLKESFNYSISGGLEPGETAKWSLAPNQFGAWGTVENKQDAVLTVEVVRLDGANDVTLFSAEFSDADQQRLESLKSSYGIK